MKTRLSAHLFVAMLALTLSQPSPAAPVANMGAFRKLFERPRVPLAPNAMAPELRDGLQYERISIASEAGMRVPMLAVSKPGGAQRKPAVICMHGLGGSKEGMGDILRELARRGYVALAFDARCHGERSANLTQQMIESYQNGKGHPYIFDTVWDCWRVLDYLQARADVDGRRLGVMGISLGGHATWMASADPRVRVAVPCISVCSWRWQLETGGYAQRVANVQGAYDGVMKLEGAPTLTSALVARAWERWMPGIPSRFDCQDVLAAMAPRPLLICGGDSDPVAPLPGAKIAIAEIEAAYASRHALDHLKVVIAPHSGHAVTPEHYAAMYAWFDRWLQPALRTATAREVTGTLTGAQAQQLLAASPGR